MSDCNQVFVLDVLGGVAARRCFDSLHSWSVYDCQVRFWVDCSGVFEPGLIDMEEITAGNLGLFLSSVDKVLEVTGGDATYAPALFAARVRGCRPFPGAYPSDQRLWALFDACGPLDGPVQTAVPG